MYRFSSIKYRIVGMLLTLVIMLWITVHIYHKLHHPGMPMSRSIKLYLDKHCSRVHNQCDERRLLDRILKPRCPCVNPNSVGRINPDMEAHPFNSTEQDYRMISVGGSWEPKYCQHLQHVAIIIPYRERLHQLRILIPRLHTVLTTQNIKYTVFVIEQRNPSSTGNQSYTYNKAMLMNIGYIEGLKIDAFECFVFHDVDFIPEDDRSMYMCQDRPLHLGAYDDSHQYKLSYSKIFGGITVFSKEQFANVNGFSNRFFGWGGEDDDMFSRTHGKISRNPSAISRYRAIPHYKDPWRKHPTHQKSVNRLLWKAKPRSDGLNTIPSLYEEVRRELLPLYTWILVDLYQTNTTGI